MFLVGLLAGTNVSSVCAHVSELTSFLVINSAERQSCG